MKKIFLLSIFCLIMLVGCTTTTRTMAGGLNNDAFLEIIGNPLQYMGGVTVDIDGSNTFMAIVHEASLKDTAKGQKYAITPGTHTITISYAKKVLYSQKIFISAQETRIITL